MSLQWEDPPAEVVEVVRRGRYADIAAALRENPGHWARLPGTRTPGSAAGLAQNIRRGKMNDFGKGQFEAVHKGDVVWARALSQVDDSDDSSDDDDATAARDIRAWARSQSLDVADRGRLAPEVIKAYDERERG